MNRIISFFVSLLFWVLLVVAQTFLFSFQGNAASALDMPELYYSVWCLDLYLIILYYINYYIIAPMMIRRKLFRPYIFITAISMGVGFAIPYVLYHINGWTMPATPPNQAPISLVGIVGALGVIAVGLALRSVSEWAKFEPQKKEVKANLATIEEQKLQIAALTNENLEHKANKTALESRIKDLEKTVDTYRDIYGVLSEEETNY